MHSQSSNWTRNAILVLAPLTLIALVAVFVGPSLFGKNDESKTKLASANFAAEPATSATTSPSVEATPEQTQTAAAEVRRKRLGTVKGLVTIPGPKRVEAGATVLFAVDGKRKLQVKDRKAPYALAFNTKNFPDGKYTVTVSSVVDGDETRIAVYSMTVKNVKKPVAKPTASASPSKAPTSKPSTPASNPSTTTSSSSGGGGGGGSSSGGTKAETYAAKVLEITNTKRAAAGCKALKLNSKLTAAAQGHSEDMAENNYFDHNSQDGRSPFDRMSDAGYKFSGAAENIAMGQQTPSDVMTSWMNSSGHKANILNCGYTEMGLGYAVGNGSPYWTQTFGTPM